MERLDKHSATHHALFDEDTAQVGSLGDLVEKHAGDAVFLTPEEKSVGGADGGLADWEAEMNETDPAPDEALDEGDLYSRADEDGLPAADVTGTVAGIARGFGTHLPQDFGRNGFQVEEMPAAALANFNRTTPDGELDDYDDPDDTNAEYGMNADESRASQPGANRVPAHGQTPATPDTLVTHDPRPRTADDELDATREIK